MRRMRVFGVALAVAAGVVAGAGMASANVEQAVPVQGIAPGEPSPYGTGSSDVLGQLLKTLATGSAQPGGQ